MTNTGIAFSGSVPELYTRYMGPVFFAPFADVLAQRVSTMGVGAILETACGTGIVTRALRKALPAAAITATDLNGAMIEHAKTFPGGEGVIWQAADAQALPFPDATFDRVVCAFGVMFFPDRVRAYREAKRVLRQGGGRFLVTVWDRLETIELQLIAHEAVAALYPDDPPAFFRRTPCGYFDLDLIRGDLAQAGFSDVSIETLDPPCRAENARDVAVGMVKGTPLSAEIVARDPGGLDAAVEATTKAITARFGAGPIDARMQAHLVEAAR